MATILTRLPGAGVYVVHLNEFLVKNGIENFTICQVQYENNHTLLEVELSEEDAVMLRLLYSEEEIDRKIAGTVISHVSDFLK